jgi:hypothetical protein
LPLMTARRSLRRIRFLACGVFAMKTSKSRSKGIAARRTSFEAAALTG